MAVAVAVRPTRTLHFLGIYVGVPLLLGWFAYIFASGLPAVTPQRFSMPTPQTYEPSMDDFAVFYSAGVLVRDGRSDIYELPVIREQEVQTTGGGDVLTLPFFSPPFAVLPFAAIAGLSPGAAAALWTVAGLVALGVVSVTAWHGWGRSVPLGFAVVFVAGAVASPPFFQVLIHGQTTFFLIAGAFLLWRFSFSSQNTAGATLGLLLISDKPQLLPIFVAFMLLDRQWRPVAAAAALAAFASAAVVLLTGPDVIPGYLHLSTHAMAWDDENGISTWGMFGWNAFARGLLGASAVARAPLTVALDALTLAALFWGRRRVRVDPMASFALVVFGTLLISPHVYEHDVLLVALPLFLLCVSAPQGWRTWGTFGLLGWMLIYFHFDVLDATGINATALWLALGIALVLTTTPGNSIGWPRNAFVLRFLPIAAR